MAAPLHGCALLWGAEYTQLACQLERKLSWGTFQALEVLLMQLNASHLIVPAAPAAHFFRCRRSAEPLVRALLLSVIFCHGDT